MENLSSELLEFLGFYPLKGTDSLVCIGCSIQLSEFRNPFIHRAGCRWMRALCRLLQPSIITPKDAEEEEFFFR